MGGYLEDRGDIGAGGHRRREPELGSLQRAVRLRLPRQRGVGAGDEAAAATEMTATGMTSGEGLRGGWGGAHLGVFPRPGHLSGLHDVGEVPVREDPTAVRETQLPTVPTVPRPGGSSPHPAPPHTLTAAPGRWRGQQRSGGSLGASPGSSSGLQHPRGAESMMDVPPSQHEGRRTCEGY